MHLRHLTSLLTAGALALSSLVALPSATHAQESLETTPAADTAPVSAAMPLSSDSKTKAWQDMRFGLFIHWGVYSMYGGYYKGKKQWLGYPEQIKAWGGTRDDFSAGGIPTSEYIAMAQSMTIPDFNAQQWCQSAKDAGMKYLLVTSKHHDGFAMWDTETTDYKFPHYSPTKRDPMKELADACNPMGVKLAFYFSIIDWSKQKAEPYQNRNKLDDEMMNLIRAQLRELLSGKYGTVPELWFDMGDPTAEQSEQMAAWVHEFSPTTMVNSRVWNEKGDFEVGGDNHLVSNMTLGPWESIRSTFPACWGYCTWPAIEAVRKSPNGVAAQTKEEVGNLFTTIANGGQYLLNIGPRGTGNFDPFEAKILEGIAQWQARHPHVIHGAVPTYYPVEKWGFTVINGNAIYLSINNWTNGGEIRLRGAGSNVTGVTIDDSTNPHQAVTYRVEDSSKDLIITLPNQAPEEILPIIKVATNGEPTYVPANVPSVEKGKVVTATESDMMTIASPLNGQGTARNIAYVRNDSTEPAKLVVGAEGTLQATMPLDVTINDVTVHTNVSELADGIEGLTVPPKTTARVIVERGNKAYYAEGFGGWRKNITSMWFSVVDPNASPVVVHHEFVSADETPLPAELKAKEPQDRQARAGSPKVTPTAVTETAVTIGENNWTFTGWDAPHKSAKDVERIEFIGKWKAGPLRYPVSYRFINASPDHQMPTDLDYFLPRTREHDKGATVTPDKVNPQVYRDHAAGKTWRFVRWENDTIENLSGAAEFVGIWEYQRDQDVTATHVFVGKDGAELPQAVLDLVPEPVTKEAPVSSLKPTKPSPTSVDVPGGKWIFDGYDQAAVRWPAGPTHTFTGTWHFEKTRHRVSFSFTSADPSKELPEMLGGAIPDPLEVPDGEGTELPQPYIGALEGDNGVWTFVGWEVERLESVTSPVTVKGVWQFTEGEVGEAEYILASGVEGVELPEELIYFMPQPEPYIVGSTAKPARLQEKYALAGDSYWKFVGWQPEQIENAGPKVSFTAKWIPISPEVTVTYAFDGGDKTLPEEVTKLLPAPSKHAFGDEHAAPKIEPTLVNTVEGEWSFVGWDKALITLEEDITLTAKWALTPRQYNVVFELGKLPQAVSALHDPNAPLVFRDNMVCAPAPANTRLETDTEVWTFQGWEKECYTLEEVLKLATVEGVQPSGPAGGAVFFTDTAKASVVFPLSFTPQWHKEAKPAKPPVTNGGTPSTPGGTGSPSSTIVNPKAPHGKVIIPGKGSPSTHAARTTMASTGATDLLALSAITMTAALSGLVMRRRREQ